MSDKEKEINTEIDQQSAVSESDDLDSLEEFGLQEDNTVIIDEDQVTLTEDLEGFAKGFPAWDLEPPKN